VCLVIRAYRVSMNCKRGAGSQFQSEVDGLSYSLAQRTSVGSAWWKYGIVLLFLRFSPVSCVPQFFPDESMNYLGISSLHPTSIIGHLV
jgi:hypothetical protein